MKNEPSLLFYKRGDSKLWRFICAQKDVVDRGTKWQVRNGSVVSFFNDHWLGEGLQVRDFAMRALTEEEGTSLVADWVVGGYWNLDKLSTFVNLEGISHIIAVLPPRLDATNDCIIWGAASDGRFSLRSAYFLIEPNSTLAKDRVFNDIWKWKGAERVRVFMWKALLDKLPTNLWRSSWSQVSTLCSHCSASVEDLLHILRDCSYAKGMWIKLIKQRYSADFFSFNFIFYT